MVVPSFRLAEIFLTSLKPLNGIQRNLTKSKDFNVLYQVSVFGSISKPRRLPVLWLTDTCSTFPQKPLNTIQRSLTRSKMWTSFTEVFLSRADQKSNIDMTCSTLPIKLLNGIQRNLARKNIWSSSTKIVFFGSIEKKKTKVVAPASDVLNYFRLVKINRWNGFERHLKGRKISASSTMIVNIWLIGNLR